MGGSNWLGGCASQGLRWYCETAANAHAAAARHGRPEKATEIQQVDEWHHGQPTCMPSIAPRGHVIVLVGKTQKQHLLADSPKICKYDIALPLTPCL